MSHRHNISTPPIDRPTRPIGPHHHHAHHPPQLHRCNVPFPTTRAFASSPTTTAKNNPGSTDADADDAGSDADDDDANGPPRPPPAPQPEIPSLRAFQKRNPRQHPQKDIDNYWRRFNSRFPGKAFRLLPGDLRTKRGRAYAVGDGGAPGIPAASSAAEREVEEAAMVAADRVRRDTAADTDGEPGGLEKKEEKEKETERPRRARKSPVAYSQRATISYDQAVEACRAKVEKIRKECYKNNQKYRDLNFDIETDLNMLRGDCLKVLDQKALEFVPGAVKRVHEIFDEPRFYVDDASSADVRQGSDGNCWLLAGVCSLCTSKEAMERICVARDEKVGVYGFVFHRDGLWMSEVIDDKLYLIKGNYNNLDKDERDRWMELPRKNPEDEWREQNQKGSQALSFASCKHPQETWLPLLEKAYAKAHNDFGSINGGFFGEAVEDLTGGMTSEVATSDIIDRDVFWQKEIMYVGTQFHFGCATGHYSNLDDINGIQSRHAYSILEAREVDGNRLLKLMNPWGKTEWRGAWSDLSEQWTPKLMEKLGHRFGDDGVFWISYEAFLKRFTNLDRTRIFDKTWQVAQLWTAITVPWASDYLDTGFRFTLKKETEIVIIMSQVDSRYFWGLEGPYKFQFQFKIYKDDRPEHGEVARSRGNVYMKRSTSAEIPMLEPGTYSVHIKILATRVALWKHPEEVVKDMAGLKREKLLRVAFQYDLAHARARFADVEKSRQRRLHEKSKERSKLRKQTIIEYNKRVKLRNARRAANRHKKSAQRGEHEPLRDDADDGIEEMTEGEDDDDASRAREARPAPPIRHSGDVDPQPDLRGETRGLGQDARGSRARINTMHGSTGAMELPIRDNDAVAGLQEPPLRAATDPSSYTSRDGTGENLPRRLVDPPVPIRTPTHTRTGASVNPSSRLEVPRLTIDDVSDSEVSWDTDEDGAFEIPADVKKRLSPTLDNEQAGSDGQGVEGADEQELEPWNAVCVLGLRVYSKDTEDEDVKIELVEVLSQQDEVDGIWDGFDRASEDNGEDEETADYIKRRETDLIEDARMGGGSRFEE